MAIVKLGRKVKTNLPGTLAYVINPAKTDGGRFVYASYSGERQDAGKLAGPMILDLESCANGMREGSVLALHLKHSFAPDENVTPERVHEMGIALAEAITGGEYRYVVSTHLDRNHLHNHIVICTANRRTRRKMRLTRGSIDQWRAVSDELCRREGLATLDNPSVDAEAGRIDMRRIMERTPGQESTAVPSASSKVVPMNGRGASMEELCHRQGQGREGAASCRHRARGGHVRQLRGVRVQYCRRACRGGLAWPASYLHGPGHGPESP